MRLLVFYMLNKPHCFKPLWTLSPIANAQQPPCSVCLLMQCFLSARDTEQPASGSADSAEHYNMDITEMATRKLNFKSHAIASSFIHDFAGKGPLFHHKIQYNGNITYLACFSLWCLLPTLCIQKR